MRRLRVPGLALALSLALPAAVGGALFQRAYPGLTAGVWSQLRYGTWEESRNVWACVAYLLAFLEKLTFDPATGKYDFERTPDAGLDDFERGRLAFHRGRFAEAAALLERHLAAEVDGDGRLDLYLTGPLPGSNTLLRNVDGRRLAPSDRLEWTEPGFTAAFVDVNHDGRLDLFHGGFADARTAVAQAVFGERHDFRSGHNVILLQGEDGRLVPRPDLFAGGDMPIGSMGASFGDLDNDGCLDFYLGTGNPEPWFVLPNLMYRGALEGDGGCTGRMENISMLQGFGTLQKGHGIVFFDFDGDGDQDVYSALGGMWPADPWPTSDSARRWRWTGWMYSGWAPAAGTPTRRACGSSRCWTKWIVWQAGRRRSDHA